MISEGKADCDTDPDLSERADFSFNCQDLLFKPEFRNDKTHTVVLK